MDALANNLTSDRLPRFEESSLRTFLTGTFFALLVFGEPSFATTSQTLAWWKGCTTPLVKAFRRAFPSRIERGERRRRAHQDFGEANLIRWFGEAPEENLFIPRPYAKFNQLLQGLRQSGASPLDILEHEVGKTPHLRGLYLTTIRSIPSGLKVEWSDDDNSQRTPTTILLSPFLADVDRPLVALLLRLEHELTHDAQNEKGKAQVALLHDPKVTREEFIQKSIELATDDELKSLRREIEYSKLLRAAGEAHPEWYMSRTALRLFNSRPARRPMTLEEERAVFLGDGFHLRMWTESLSQAWQLHRN